MGKTAVRQMLQTGSLVFDGATGTYLRSQIGFSDEPVEQLCLSDPDRVLAMHRAYLACGCMVLRTNTFNAHVGMAAKDDEHQAALVCAAVELCKKAARTYGALVFADIGPAPSGACAATCYIKLADCFLAQGIDCFVFETMHNSDGLKEAAKHIKSVCPDAFVQVSFSPDPDGYTRTGEMVGGLLEKMDSCDEMDAVGVNCVCGAYHMRKLVARLPKLSKLLSVFPNAGYPRVEDGRTYYDSDPTYYAQQLTACVPLGAKLIGGCCGTTPEHIRAILHQLRFMQVTDTAPDRMKKPEETVCKSGVQRKLDAGKRVIFAEIDPPRSSDIGGFLAGARAVVAAGADVITIADCPIGRARMDASLLACKLRRELGVETMPHMTCRDRNINATKALLLGLSMEDVHNVLVVTGDPVPASDSGDVKGVFQFNSRVLARFISELSQENETDAFFICGALNVNAVCFEKELERALDKEKCGVKAFLTQPVLSKRAAENLAYARKKLHAYVIGGLFPVVSEKNACFLQNEVAGIAVDDEVVQAYAGLDREQGEALAVQLCLCAAKEMAPHVDGFYIMTPFSRTALVERVIRALGGI